MSLSTTKERTSPSTHGQALISMLSCTHEDLLTWDSDPSAQGTGLHFCQTPNKCEAAGRDSHVEEQDPNVLPAPPTSSPLLCPQNLLSRVFSHSERVLQISHTQLHNTAWPSELRLGWVPCFNIHHVFPIPHFCSSPPLSPALNFPPCCVMPFAVLGSKIA